ncbi:hypothetical protein O159_22910 [Leifsonia xyli subsp. cynodontis DSM 46306]|uniref:Terminase small subunit n=1 Tax=Leifsonia xyli subsp. cynodontis DSM 46306 TaxID=1389489 RepID=U3PF30_LEIXC|nr:hypothetical protein [Leifsonia xyli]AGW41730.1 hypothetical protein O159_16860 [Leifsonia xyli subsp. cynodontis DSM 46306]AGW42253.1 hypothetical protein O159_22910 [Leifsonia xyli subsp. cynodontis DSM 46306]
MPSGGARNRSGPQADLSSGRSEQRGIKLAALPAGGFTGEIPEFPLPIASAIVWTTDEDGRRAKRVDEDATEEQRSRELEVWCEAWRTPQAIAWKRESWRWPVIGEYCRLKTIVERDPGANATLVGQLHRFRDQIGLTPAGMRENGWAIAVDVVAEKREERSETPTAAPARRLRAVNGGR